MKLTVVHLEGSKQGQTEHLPGPVIEVGRDPSCALSFDPHVDLDVSARHATISFQGGQLVLQDLDSRNGTFLNGARVQGAVPLPNESTVQFGEGGPKVRVSFSLGPGKKTQMIDDLNRRLEDASVSQARTRRRALLLSCLVVFALGLLGLGVAGMAWQGARTKLRVEVVGDDGQGGLKRAAASARERAKARGAASEPAAAAAWQAAVASFAAGEAAEAEDMLQAKERYLEAAERFNEAGDQAGLAAMAAMKRLADEAEANRRKEQEAMQRELQRIKEENEAKLAALTSRLGEAKGEDLLGELRRLLTSSDPAQVERGIDEVKRRLEAAPDDAELKDLLARLEARLAELSNVDDKLKAAATAAKTKVVAVRSHVFAIPKGQRLDTTRIRHTVARGEGTGFFVTATGHVATSKEAVQPWLFEPQALALYTKLEEKGMQFFTDLEVWTSVAGVYTATYAGAQVTIVRVQDTAAGAERTVTIPFDNIQQEVTVRPHRRDSGCLALIKCDVQDVPFLTLAGKDAAPGTPLVTLGTQRGGPDLPGDATGLYLFQGTLKADEQRLALDCPSLPTWVGGPILGADGKVLGLLIETGTQESRAVAARKLRELLPE